VSLRHALLGLLTAEPLTGYEMTKVFDRSVAYVWHAPHSQIYPELRRMEGQGLITSESSLRGKRGVKRTYAITAEGREELERWLAEPSEPEPVRDTQRLKATYLEFVSFDDARRLFQAHLSHYELWERRWAAHAEELAARSTNLLRARLSRYDIGDHEAIVAYKVHVYDGLVANARAEVKWAKEGLKLIGELEANDLSATATGS
jgi:PadR family transcriptional regulator, regulator of vanillate utilization